MERETLDQHLWALLGSWEAVRGWWTSPNRHWQGRTPESVYETDSEAVKAYILRHCYGDYGQMMRSSSTFHIGPHAWPRPTVFLTDYAFWHQHQRELAAWCREHGAQQRGMTLAMDESALTLFALRWA